MSPLVTGIAIGFITSLIGGVFSYIVYLRRSEERTSGPLIYQFVVTGTLVLVGAFAIMLSLFVGELDKALVTGVGVLIGFFVAFALLLGVYMRLLPTSD